jgi:hypothetical protein
MCRICSRINTYSERHLLLPNTCVMFAEIPIKGILLIVLLSTAPSSQQRGRMRRADIHLTDSSDRYSNLLVEERVRIKGKCWKLIKSIPI